MDEDFDPVEAQRIADALVGTLPDAEQQAKVYDAIAYRTALMIVSGDTKFKSIREALEAAKVFQRIASDLRTSTAKQAAAKAAEDTADALQNLNAVERQTLMKELTAKAQEAARGTPHT